MRWIINIGGTKKFSLEDDTIMVPVTESDGYVKGKLGTPDQKPTSTVSAFISVWVGLGLWQDLSLSSRVMIPSGLSLAWTTDFHSNMYNIIDKIEIMFAEIVYYKFLSLLIPSGWELLIEELYSYTNWWFSL